MKSLISFLSLLWMVLAGAPAVAQDLTFRGCTDARGRPVASQLDVEAPSLVATEAGRRGALIRYNPRALPDANDAVRAFFYAHECARHSLGLSRQARDADTARQADCAGLATLQRSGMLTDPADLAALQSALAFSPAQWARLPGPPRGFDLAACPSSRPVVRSDPAWNQCVHRCGDALFRCGRGAGCQSTYDRCEAACGR